jgi:hypothetical protein
MSLSEAYLFLCELELELRSLLGHERRAWAKLTFWWASFNSQKNEQPKDILGRGPKEGPMIFTYSNKHFLVSLCSMFSYYYEERLLLTRRFYNKY